jgi:hypothetical protein
LEANIMKTIGFSDLLNRLEGFDQWLINMGLTPRPNDRIHEAFKVLHRAEQASRQGQQTGRYSNIQPQDWFAIVEALEAHDIFMAFQSGGTAALATELKRALRGPKLPIHETQKSRDGRNIWYQLALAADWKLGGASVFVEEPDLRLTRDGITFLVACKRPANENSVDANIYDAVKQLHRNLKDSPPNAVGIVAISLNCIFNPGDKVFSGDLEALGAALAGRLANHERYLHSLYDPTLCCILFHIATPGSRGEDVDLQRASFTLACDFGHPSISSRVFAEHLQAVYQSAQR